ncbi:diamine oxidase [copper-containing]-like [Rhopilema esculentum]|uniref:diamine oxidase [copper-containing]-like n=1 Tax=Rhopilema esculentum TaxID=499914 RepID=UPI0031DA8159
MVGGHQTGRGRMIKKDTGADRKPGVPASWKVLVAALCALIVALVIALCIVATKATADDSSKAAPSKGPSCSSPYKQDTKLPKDPSVFQDLSPDELHAVRDYLMKQSSLNLTAHGKSTMDSNFIYLIELYLPNKKDVLDYLDNNGKMPARRARVIIVNGGKSSPDVEEYLVSPLPTPSTHQRLYLAHRANPVPFSSRPSTGKEDDEFDKILKEVTTKCYVVLKESFNLWYGENCSKNCLRTYIDGTPAAFRTGQRKTWAIFFKDVIGYDLHPVPFEVLVNHADSDVKKWQVEQIYYHNQYFKSAAELVQKYRQGTINKTVLTFTSSQDLSASFRRRGKSFLKSPMREPTLVSPQGRRFDVAGRKISYMGWDFHFGMRSSAGPALYDIRFNNTRIMYELSMQEATSFYSANDPRQSSAQYFDSAFRIGSTNYELIKGIDCPEEAVFFDSYHFVDTANAAKHPKSICVFEINNGIPIRRHIGFDSASSFSYVAGLVDSALVIRTVLTPQNYDYIIDFIFYQTGAVETRLSTSGYIIASSYYPTEAPYAYESLPRTQGTIHDHIILFKADLDVVGTKNSYQTLDVQTKNVSVPWNDVGYLIKKQVVRNTKKTEKQALLNYNFDHPKYLVVHNENAKNKYGNPRGYRLQLDSMVKQKYPDDYFVTKAAAWSKYQLAVTKYKDGERYGSSIYNQHGMDPPAFDFDEYVKDDENIENQDLVAWVSLGCLHVPNTEDIPVTVTPGNRFSFFVRPYGYFDEDPSMSSTNAVIVSTDGKGGTKVEKYGTPDDSSCPVPKRTITFTPNP